MSSMCVTYREQVYAKKSDNEYGTPLDWYELILSTNYILPNVNSKIFPNPFSEKIEIQLPSNADYFIQLLNSIGQIIYSEKLNGSRTFINTEQLPSGAYFLRINSDQTMETVQLIK
ncbi:MAG: T9SS type A sorting domain-containing protein [Flavobacteriales bacterium]|nr:T9SS type A sorting domain-containing protein [Flavobacteriales bacterium]